jgi:hypothetical protein
MGVMCYNNFDCIKEIKGESVSVFFGERVNIECAAL